MDEQSDIIDPNHRNNGFVEILTEYPRATLGVILTLIVAFVGVFILNRDPVAPPPVAQTIQAPQHFAVAAKTNDTLVGMAKRAGLTKTEDIEAFIAYQGSWMIPVAHKRCDKLAAHHGTEYIEGKMTIDVFKKGRKVGSKEVDRPGEYCNKGQEPSQLAAPWWSEALQPKDLVLYSCELFPQDERCAPVTLASR